MKVSLSLYLSMYNIQLIHYPEFWMEMLSILKATDTYKKDLTYRSCSVLASQRTNVRVVLSI